MPVRHAKANTVLQSLWEQTAAPHPRRFHDTNKIHTIIHSTSEKEI
jgi:hypothetical protein